MPSIVRHGEKKKNYQLNYDKMLSNVIVRYVLISDLLVLKIYRYLRIDELWKQSCKPQIPTIGIGISNPLLKARIFETLKYTVRNYTHGQPPLQDLVLPQLNQERKKERREGEEEREDRTRGEGRGKEGKGQKEEGKNFLHLVL